MTRRDGPGAPDQAEQPVDEQRGDRDVEQRRQRDLPDERLDEREHLLASLAPGPRRSGTAARSGRAVPPRPAAAPRAAATRAGRAVVLVERGEPVEQVELLGRERGPAALVVQLDEREVEADVVRVERQREVAGVERRVGVAVAPVGGREVEQPLERRVRTRRVQRRLGRERELGEVEVGRQVAVERPARAGTGSAGSGSARPRPPRRAAPAASTRRRSTLAGLAASAASAASRRRAGSARRAASARRRPTARGRRARPASAARAGRGLRARDRRPSRTASARSSATRPGSPGSDARSRSISRSSVRRRSRPSASSRPRRAASTASASLPLAARTSASASNASAASRPPVERGQRLRPAQQRRLVARREAEGGRVVAQRVGRPLAPHQGGAGARVRRRPLGRDRGGLRVGGRGPPRAGRAATRRGRAGARPCSARRGPRRSCRLPPRRPAQPPSSSTSSAFWAWSRFSDCSKIDAPRPVHHVGRDLLAAVRRQTVHHERVGRHRQQVAR